MNMSPVFAVTGGQPAISHSGRCGYALNWPNGHHFGAARENQEFIDRLDRFLNRLSPLTWENKHPASIKGGVLKITAEAASPKV